MLLQHQRGYSNLNLGKSGYTYFTFFRWRNWSRITCLYRWKPTILWDWNRMWQKNSVHWKKKNRIENRIHLFCGNRISWKLKRKKKSFAWIFQVPWQLFRILLPHLLKCSENGVSYAEQFHPWSSLLLKTVLGSFKTVILETGAWYDGHPSTRSLYFLEESNSWVRLHSNGLHFQM